MIGAKRPPIAAEAWNPNEAPLLRTRAPNGSGKAEIFHRGRSLRGESRALVVIYRSKDPV
jgi:hypothetical protein